MTEDEILKAFVTDALLDVGATLSEGSNLLWVQIPPSVEEFPDLPTSFCLTFDPGAVGRFGAELVAPGSYVLERLLASAMRRGRWDVGRLVDPQADWWRRALADAGLGPERGFDAQMREAREDWLFLLTFRVSLLSDEKRESFHALAVSPNEGEAWPVDLDAIASSVGSAAFPGFLPDLEGPYRLARGALLESTRADVEAFRRSSLVLLDEEVRRILTYYDRTVEEVREAAPSEPRDLVRAIETERDRRLAEAVERFDARATAALCGIRAVLVPEARVRIHPPGRPAEYLDVRVDAWTRSVRGVRCAVCESRNGPWCLSADGTIACGACASKADESARPPARPRSGTPRRRTRDGQGEARFPRGSMARSPASVGPRRGS